MPFALLLAWQVATPTAAGQSAPVAGPKLDGFDLAGVRPKPCETEATGDVVVCGRRDTGRFRISRLPDEQVQALPKAEVGVIGDLKASATVDQATMPDGTISKRLMFTLKLPF